MKNVIRILRERGLIEAVTNEEIESIVENPIKVYCGFDPTCDSLHLGNMVAIMALAWFQRCGHTPVVIVGGATGLIGDPSGKSHERPLLDETTIAKNLKGIQVNLEAILDFHHASVPALLLNNWDWYKNFSMINFLRDVGKHFRVGQMLSKESVKARLASDEGMSFTEFCYQLLQGYDFLYLLQNYGVTLEVGGSDQWGNITAGKELIRKVVGTNTYGVTFPLLTTSDGKKFGKSEGGAIWLSSEKLSPYHFYQHLVRTADSDVIRLMRMLTFMDLEEIATYQESMQRADYVPNTAQKRLAEEITRIVHGEEKLQIALHVTEKAAPGSIAELNAERLESIASDFPTREAATQEVAGQKLVDLIVAWGLLPSKGEARRLIRNGGVYLNEKKVEDEGAVIMSQDLIEGRLLLVAVGKKNKVLIRVKN